MTDSIINLKIINLLNSSNNYSEFKENLKKALPDITIKDNDENIALIANKYKVNNFDISELEQECKNIFIDKNNLKLLVYSNNNIFYNDEANNFLLKNKIEENFKKEIYESFEGTTLTLYNFKGKWNLSTRKCLDSEKSKWSSNLSFYNLFCDSINMPFEDFTNNLNPNYYYFFVLLHHKNINLIDYTLRFGKNYKKILHIMTRKSDTHKEVDLEDPSQFINKMNLLKPEKLNDYELINNSNKLNKIELPINLEGIIIKLTHNETKKTYLLKIQTNSYKILNKLNPRFNNILKTFIALYKNELLKEHLIYFPDNKNVLLKTDNKELEFDTIGIIDGIFKVLTSELFELFKSLYNLRDCSQKNKILYDILPLEYKIILYKIRGVYFEKKDLLSKVKNKDNNFNYKKYNLKIIDIYNLLKKYDIDLFLKLLSSRLLIIKKPEFSSISNRCENNLLNIANIFNNNIV